MVSLVALTSFFYCLSINLKLVNQEITPKIGDIPAKIHKAIATLYKPMTNVSNPTANKVGIKPNRMKVK